MPKEAKNKENKKVKKAKEKKNSFFKDTKAELKKVIWPTSKQLINNTLAVIAVVLIIGIIVLVLDICFEKINEFGVDKLKSAIQSTQTNSEDEASANTEVVESEDQAETSDAESNNETENTENSSESNSEIEGTATDEQTENAE